MERLDEGLLTGILEKEHEHRYQWVKKLVSGTIVDCSCGMGYGATILTTNPTVTHYLGLDIDKDVIDYAKHRYGNPDIEFRSGNICSLTLPDASIDSFISLETLEHLEQPEKAIQEIRRIVRLDGIFVGSVPTAHYETLCSAVYGSNPYHIQSFDDVQLFALLKEQFPYVALFTAAVEVGTFFHALESETVNGCLCQPKVQEQYPQLGSFMFVATADEQKMHKVQEQLGQLTGFVRAMNMVEYDREQIVPLRQTMQEMTSVIDAKDQVIKRAEVMIDERTQYISQLEQYKDYVLEFQQHWLYKIATQHNIIPKFPEIKC